jgi:Na+(H+)/acetate symporter ActP
MRESKDSGCGCGAIFGAFLLLAIVVGTVISLAAVVDPFSQLPTPAAIWSACNDAAGSGSGCTLADRFPGFWGHVGVSLAYTLVTAVAFVLLVATAAGLREAAGGRFDDAEAAARYVESRGAFLVAAAGVAALGLLAIVVALTPSA